MTAFLVVECIALLFLFSCSAFFSSAETALFSLNIIQIYHLRKTSPTVADRIEKMLASPTSLLSTILICNTVVNIIAVVLGYTIIKRFYPEGGEILSIAIMTLLLLVLGEVAPKRFAMFKAEAVAVAYSPILIYLIRLMAPLRISLEQFAVWFEDNPDPTGKSLTEDEFLTVVEDGEEEGVLDKEQRTMVDGIIRLEEIQASDIMTPRVDLTGIDMDDPKEEWKKTAESAMFRYLPVYAGTLDNTKGFLDVPRFLLSPDYDFNAALIQPFFVPETAPLDSLLAIFQKENRRIAFVVDEYGGTAGLITRGDILEEIVDDVDSEYGNEKRILQKMGENRWLIDGNASLEDINYDLGLSLEAEGADRIAGWVIVIAEHIPRIGEVVEGQGCRVIVQRVRRNRITLVVLEKEINKEGAE